MAGLGELFIELGVFADTKELQKMQKELNKTVEKMNEAVEAAKEEIIYNEEIEKTTKKIVEATKDYNEAIDEETKKIAENALNAAKAQKERLVHLRQQKILAKNAKDAARANQEQIDKNKELANEVARVVKGIGVFIGAITGAAIALNRLTNDLVQSNQAMLNLTRTSDISLSTFQKWGSIGKMLGVNNAAQQIEGLNQRLFELRLTGQGARGFQLAGINPTGDADDVMEQLRARVSGMSDTSASYLLREMGLDPQMLHLLRLGREEFEELGKTVKKYQLTEKQRAEIQRMNIQLEIARQKLQYLKDRAVLAIMPYFVELAKSFARVTEMLLRWGKAIKNANVWWRGLITGLVYGLGRLEKVRLFFKDFSKVLSEGITKIPIFGRVFAGLGKIFSKVLFPLTALYLLLDDLAVYFEGGDSLIGRVLNWGQEKGSEIGDAFKKMFGGDFLGGMGDLANTTLDGLNDVLKVIINLLEKILNILTLGFSDKIKNSGIIKFLLPSVDEVFEQVTGKLAPNDRLSMIEHRQIVPSTTEQNIRNSNSVSNNTNNQQITQNIQIATNQPAYDIERELRFINEQFA